MYALIHDGKIKVGPRQWKNYFFKEYLDDQGLDSTSITVLEPNNRKIITDNWKILPVTELFEPSYNNLVEQLAGPYWTIHENHITGAYTISNLSMESSKSKLKEYITTTRYNKEIEGCIFTFPDGIEVTLHTSREERNSYIQAYQIMTDEQPITYKFKNSVFKVTTKLELKAIIDVITDHVQKAFNWEAQKYAEVDACTDVEQLKTINLIYPK